MNQHTKFRIATILLLTALIAAAFPTPASAIIVKAIAAPGEMIDNPLNLLQTTPTDTPTNTPVPPTSTPPPPTVDSGFVRPQIAVRNYRTNPGEVRYGEEFKLFVRLKNEGQVKASNVQVSFTSADFLALRNGGVVNVGELAADHSVDIEQLLTAATYLYGKAIAGVEMNLSYYDDSGVSYAEKFTLNIAVAGGGYVSVATATPTGVHRSQLVITGYQSDVDLLQPGVTFTLKMLVQNAGNITAKGVTMIVGGGSSGTSSGTPQAGGVSGGSGEFTNFAPVGASNVQSLGDLEAGKSAEASQNLIVNVTTNPGAYPMKVTFSYLNDKGEVINDEQVITLLVYGLPTLDVSFYRPPDPFFVGQPGALPVQVVNLGKRTAVLGTLKIESANGTIENGTSLIGSLDAGGYFTLDSMFIPEQSGTLELDITIDYTDDFNQPRTITRTLEVEVMEGFAETPIDPSLGNGGGVVEEIPLPGEESVWQKLWRFVLGVLGLDSAPPSNSDPGLPPPIEEPLPGPRPGAGKG
ncbi:MAG TPA: hypothetical protein VI524_10085 [Anaerolineales bacterium]|nr:hypothetical protein [Anaerolineales bacterium]